MQVYINTASSRPKLSELPTPGRHSSMPFFCDLFVFFLLVLFCFVFPLDNLSSSSGQHVLAARHTLGEPSVVANDVAGSLVGLEADRESVGGDVPVDALGARRGGQGARVTTSRGESQHPGHETRKKKKREDVI